MAINIVRAERGVLRPAHVRLLERVTSLKPSDKMTLKIRSSDGRLDLGEQQTLVRAA